MATAPETPIPFTVVGGFLGAGKTTLLNRLLREAAGRRYAVLVNDFGGLSIDGSLISEHGGETIALANGCICCSIGDSLIDALIGLLARPVRPDHILVEASGVSDPRRIADIAMLDRALAADLVAVLVDAETVRALADDRLVGDTVGRQLDAADVLVVNKIDLVDATALAALDAWLAAAAPQAARVQVRDAAVPVALLLGEDAVRPPRRQATPAARHDPEAGFRSDIWQVDRPLDRRAFEAAVAALPPSVLRGKGWLRFTDRPAVPYVFQRVGCRWRLDPADRTARAPDGCCLTFVGTAEMPAIPALLAACE